MKKHLTLILMVLGLAGMLQAKVVRGVVTDPTGEGVIAASVVVKGTAVGTVTDFDGNYSLEVPDDAETLVFSYIGMRNEERAIQGEVINVQLSEDNTVLDEVIVTGYGTTKKRDLVTSVASVSADQLKDVPVTSAAEALEGKLAGVQVTTTEGSPDADVKIRVRGGTSLTQSSEPLYIVDGFPVSSIADISPNDIQSIDVLKDAAATAIYGAKGANGVIMITTKETKFSTDDKNKLKVHADYSGYMGWRTIANHYKMMNNEDYLRMQYEYLYLSENGNAEKLESRFFKPYNTYDPQQGRYGRTPNIAGWDKQQYITDNDFSAATLPGLINFWSDKGTVNWQDEIYGGNHLNSNHMFGFNIANKIFSMDLHYNRIDDNSIMYGSNFNRNNASLKLKVQPVKGLTIGVNGRYVNTNTIGSGTNSMDEAKNNKSDSRLRNTVSFLPLYGLPVLLAANESVEEESEQNVWNIFNPFTSIDDNYKTKTEHKWSINGYISYKFLNHFTVRAEAGYDSRAIDQKRYFGASTSYARSGDGKSQAVAEDGSPLGHVLTTNTAASSFKQTATFEYAQKFRGGRHDLSVMAGEEVIINKGRNLYGYYFGFDPSRQPTAIFGDLSSAKKTLTKEYINPNDNLLSFFARANYVLYGRYYLTGTFRADASTKFAPGHQWGYFPSLALAWRMIDERWMEPAQDVMSNWKWRLSYGTVGNNNVDLGYLHANYVFDNTANYLQDMNDVLIDGKYGADSRLTAANPDLKWETTTTRDFGMDFGFLNERISGTIDLYWNTTNDLILRYKLATGGYNYQYRNIGSTDNKGVEFSIRGVVLDHRSKDLSYGLTIDANIAHNKNTVVSLGGMDNYEISSECFGTFYKQLYEFNITPGSTIGDIYGYQTDGIYTVEDFTHYKNGRWETNEGVIETPLGNAYPGMTKLKSDSIVKLGNAMPVINGGFGLSWFVGGEKWGKVDMTANFTYSVGNQVINMTALDFSMISTYTKNRNLLALHANHYTLLDANGSRIGQEYITSADVTGADYVNLANAITAANAGVTTANPYSSSYVLTDKFVEDASFLRLASLNIGYSLPEVWLKKAHISTARIFFSATNLFVATKYSGADPEVDTRSGINPLAVGVDFSAFPKSRSFNFGLNLAF